MVEQRALARLISDRTTDCLCSKAWSDRKLNFGCCWLVFGRLMERNRHVYFATFIFVRRANALCSTMKNRQDEIKHLKDTLNLNSYLNTTLIKKSSNRTEQQFKGFAIISYYLGLTEKIRRCLSNHNVKTVLHHWQETR